MSKKSDLCVYETMEIYGSELLPTEDMVSALTGIKKEVFLTMIEEFGTIQEACENRQLFKKNITKRQLQKLQIMGEIFKRNTFLSKQRNVKIYGYQEIVNMFMDELKYLKEEHFYIVLLNTKNVVIKTAKISMGTINASIVHPREVFKEAIKHSANSIILVHNHPSGRPEPSREDKEITNRLIEVGNVVGIKVIDHIIIGFDTYVSFKKENLLPREDDKKC